MTEVFAAFPWLFAQNPPAGGGAQTNALSPLLTAAPLLLMFYYFLLIRPRQLEDRKRKDMINGLKKNDRVLTAAGIYGTVVSVDAEANKVVLRVDDDRGVKLAFSKDAIVRVMESTVEKVAEPA